MSDAPQASPQGILGDAALPLRFVDPSHEEPKKKKAHRKSRGGCKACKKRRVKVRHSLIFLDITRVSETSPWMLNALKKSAMRNIPAETAYGATRHATRRRTTPRPPR